MTKIKDLGITVRPAFGDYAIYDDATGCGLTNSDECPANEMTCGMDDQDKQPKPKKYYAFTPELISQFKQQLDSHLGP